MNRRVPVDFRQFLIRHLDLFRCLHHWTVRLLVPRRFRKAVALYKAAVREELILAGPQYVLCREDCRGLCPRCGKDLNAGPCGCPAVAPNPRLAVLHTLARGK